MTNSNLLKNNAIPAELSTRSTNLNEPPIISSLAHVPQDHISQDHISQDIDEPPTTSTGEPSEMLRQRVPEDSTSGTSLVVAEVVGLPEVQAVIATELPTTAKVSKKLPWYRWPDWLFARSLDLFSLLLILAIVAAVPIVQLASLGYILVAAGNLAQGDPWRRAFPGLRMAGKLGTFALIAGILWIPVYFVNDLSYSAQLLQPSSSTAKSWRLGAFLLTFAWVTHVGWAAMRGGRWWHFLWPAPVRFIVRIFRPSTWRETSSRLYDTVASLHFTRLWWIGARAAAGALLWIAVPVSMMIVGERAENFPGAGFVGFLGAVAMIAIMFYLPFSQIQFAVDNRFASIFDFRRVRRRFLYAPWAHAISLLLLCLLCIPLYLLRIEAAPAELLWAPSLVFILLMFPAKLALGAAIGYAEGRQHRRNLRKRHWTLRWPARMVAFTSVLIYVGALYVAQLVAGQGAYVMYFQHAFLVPAPLISS